MTQTAAWIFTSVIALLVVFQAALAAGAPLGRFAWGGGHERLSAPLRIGSLVSIPIYGLCAAIVLDRAGVVDLMPDAVSRTGSWIVGGLLALGVVMNAISRSPRERFTMTPVALVLAVTTFIVAAS